MHGQNHGKPSPYDRQPRLVSFVLVFPVQRRHRFRFSSEYATQSRFFRTSAFRHGIFKIEVERVTSSTNPSPSTRLLDVELGAGKRLHSTGHLDTRPFRRPTTMWSPLQPQQPPKVHSFQLARAVLTTLLQKGIRAVDNQIFLEKSLADFVEGSPEHIATSRARTFFKANKPAQSLLNVSQRACAGHWSWMVITFVPLWAQNRSGAGGYP